MNTRVTDQARHHPVSMQGGAEMISRNEKILSSLLLGKDMAGASRMDLQFASEEISCLRHDVVISPHAGEFSVALQSRECPGKFRNIVAA